MERARERESERASDRESASERAREEGREAGRKQIKLFAYEVSLGPGLTVASRCPSLPLRPKTVTTCGV